MHPFNEAMTVNRIVQEYPRTEPVFRQLLISVPYEGCTCLDELAWRHGMDTDELIARLEQAIDTDRSASARRSSATPAGACADAA